MIKTNKTYLLALLPFVIIVTLFEIIPLLTVIVRSFWQEGGSGFTMQHYIDIFGKKLYRDAVYNSVVISIASSLAGIVIAFFGAKAAHAATGKMRTFFMSILNMTSNFAGVPLAFAFIILLGNVGVMVMIGKTFGIAWLSEFDLYSCGGLLLVYVYFQTPLATLLLIPAFDGLRKEWREAARMMGADALTYWLRVGLANLLPGIAGTLSVLFSNAIAAYATTYALLAGNFSVLPIRISEQFIGEITQRREFGSALAVVLMLLMVAAVAVNNAVLKRQKWSEARHAK